MPIHALNLRLQLHVSLFCNLACAFSKHAKKLMELWLNIPFYFLLSVVAIGTLRYMGARLRGFDQGRKKDDPLRVELDKIRAKLVELKKLDAANESTEDNKSKETTPCEKERRQNKVKRRKVLDKNASGRMINNAL